MKIRKIIIAVIIIAAAIYAYRHFAGGAPGADGHAGMGGMPPAEVEVVTVQPQEIIAWNEFSGRLQAVDDIELRPRISGQIEKVHFKDGQMVKKGDILFTIDPDPFYAQLKRAEGSKAQAQAQNILAETESVRAGKLYDAKAISKQEYDQRQANAKANIASYKSASAEAELAGLSLSYTKVRAPISGKVGRAEVTTGNMVAEGQTILTTLVAVAPIYATFDVDENTYLRVTTPDQKSKVLLGRANDDEFPFEGKIQGFDNQISPESGTIRARAIFENKDGTLIPGLYAKVKIGSPDPIKVIMVDQKAVGTDQDKKFVFVVKPDNTADYRPIVLGGTYENKRIIASGLQAGDKVIVNGIQKVMPGAPVKPIPAKADTVPMQVTGMPAEAAAPKVEEPKVVEEAKEEKPVIPQMKDADAGEIELPPAPPKTSTAAPAVKKLPLIENQPKAPSRLSDVKPAQKPAGKTAVKEKK